MVPRLKEKYKKEIIPQMKEKFKYKNIMSVPKIDKVVINMGVGRAVTDKAELDNAVKELSLITGQKPAITKSRKSIAGFKIRDNVPIGCRVTLRNVFMYEFLDRLLNIAIPRIRDFRGLPINSFDKRGNYNFGIKDQSIFPEINPDTIKTTQGMNITVVTTSETDDEAVHMLELFGFPFKKKKDEN
ncbi:MAG: 50S ribosomal protein L5 [Candidatus Aureabacteria bacterium]|nr:50S ribosomal protein L5 [Candidatus Auribacterota bacterium]